MTAANSILGLVLLAVPLSCAFSSPRPVVHRPRAVRRARHPLAAAEGDSDDSLAASLRERMQFFEEEEGPQSLEGEGEPPSAATPPLAAAPPPADGGSVFRFEEPAPRSKSQYAAGLDDSDQQRLTRLATIWGGRALTAITLSSLVFYIYVGLSGGITDGFDRYTEPIEDIRTTMAREDARFAQ